MEGPLLAPGWQTSHAAAKEALTYTMALVVPSEEDNQKLGVRSLQPLPRQAVPSWLS